MEFEDLHKWHNSYLAIRNICYKSSAKIQQLIGHSSFYLNTYWDT